MVEPSQAPWRAVPVDPEETFFLDVNIIRADGLAVGVAVHNGDIDRQTVLANAQMMAAAPELLAALKRLTYERLTTAAIDLAIDAIARAEGTSGHRSLSTMFDRAPSEGTSGQ